MTESIEQRILSLEKHIAQQPKSPLFAQLASYYLDTGRPQEALSLCDKGLAYYPFYTTGHLIKGKTLLALNMKSEARREFEIVHDTMPSNEAVAGLLAKIPLSSDEMLAPPTAAAQPAESGVRSIKPKAKTEQPPVQATTVDTVVPEPAASPAPPAQTSAEQVLSQFTETPANVAATPSPEPTVSFEAPAPETPIPSKETSSSPEDPFGITAPAGEPAETFGPASEAQPEAVVTDQQTTPPPQPVDEGEPFEAFAERARIELIGTENTLSLDEYLYGHTQPEAIEPASPPMEQESAETAEDPFAALRQVTTEETPAEEPAAATTEEPPASQNQIEEIAEKLREAKRITPVINLSEKSTTPLSELETPAGTGFVTPTLAEIYAKQGWFDDAIKAYKTLAANKPSERDKFEKRIQELEEMKKQQTGQ